MNESISKANRVAVESTITGHITERCEDCIHIVKGGKCPTSTTPWFRCTLSGMPMSTQWAYSFKCAMWERKQEGRGTMNDTAPISSAAILTLIAELRQQVATLTEELAKEREKSNSRLLLSRLAQHRTMAENSENHVCTTCANLIDEATHCEWNCGAIGTCAASMYTVGGWGGSHLGCCMWDDKTERARQNAGIAAAKTRWEAEKAEKESQA